MFATDPLTIAVALVYMIVAATILAVGTESWWWHHYHPTHAGH
jgi:hypothetical protein